MFVVEVRDHIMIAHSFRGAFFGPAQKLHGATFIVDAAFFSKELDENGVVVDIGAAHSVLKSILSPLNYQNLDDNPDFKGKNTTTEFISKYIFDELKDAALKGTLGREAGQISRIRVTLHESHVARAGYEADLS